MQTRENVENIAKIICNKKEEDSFEECFQTNGSSICSQYGKCRIKEKSQEQLDYIISSIDENIYLEACPGSGKTEVVALKAAYEIRKWNRTGGMAFLTFTNEAAKVIEDRVNEINNNLKSIFPHFIGTLHSFIHGYISQPYGYKVIEYEGKSDKTIRVIEDKVEGEWLNNYKVRGKALPQPIRANQILINPVSDEITIRERGESFTLNQYYNKKNFQKNITQCREYFKDPNYFEECFFKTKCKEAKKKFFEDGFATFDDMLYIAYLVLINNTQIAENISKRFNTIFIDECQDLSETEIGIIRILMENGAKIHLIGDLNQAIYEYKNATPEITKEFIEDKNFNSMRLSICFRCNQSIVNTFQNLIKGKEIKGNQNNKLEKSCIFVDYKDIDNNKLINWYNQYCNRQLGRDSKRKILVRAKKFKKELLGSEEQEKIPSIICDWNTNNLILKNEALKLFGREICRQIGEKYIGNQYGCPETIDNILAWKKFLASILNESKPLVELNTTYAKWYAEVRKILKPIIERNYKNYLIRYDKEDHSKQIKAVSFRTPNDKSEKDIQLLSPKKSQFDNVQTIHSVKGQTFDSIMLVSNDRKGKKLGESMEEWLTDPQSEYVRMAYVASSRPKELLVWTAQNIDTKQRKKLIDLGFQEEKIDINLLRT